MSEITKKLQQWYHQNKRDLPWRNTNDPYLIWVSEIILQQTRVDQGLAYYNRFVDKFPTVEELAKSKLDDVLRIWQGLGYYSRARNLYESANIIMEKYNGQFPYHYSEVMKLKGIGEYTASAIVSFAYKKAMPVVDGNVVRFISRLFGIKENIITSEVMKKIKHLASTIIDSSQPDIHNQAIMEFGALMCLPRNPICITCPFKKSCFAYINNMIDSIPVKPKKKIAKNRYFNYLFIHDHQHMLIHKRDGVDIWKSLYELPLIETDKHTTLKKLRESEPWKSLFHGSAYEILNKIPLSFKHQLTHQTIHASFYMIKHESISDISGHDYLKLSYNQINSIAFPKLIINFFRRIKLNISVI